MMMIDDDFIKVWDLHPSCFCKEVFNMRDIFVSDGNSYNSLTIQGGRNAYSKLYAAERIYTQMG